MINNIKVVLHGLCQHFRSGLFILVLLETLFLASIIELIVGLILQGFVVICIFTCASSYFLLSCILSIIIINYDIKHYDIMNATYGYDIFMGCGFSFIIMATLVCIGTGLIALYQNDQLIFDILVGLIAIVIFLFMPLWILNKRLGK